MNKPDPLTSALRQIDVKQQEVDKWLDIIAGIELDPKAKFKTIRIRAISNKIRKLTGDINALKRNVNRMQGKN